MKKLVVITGASSGIGKAAAIKFSKEGYPLLLLARRVELLEELKLPNAICLKLDVTDYEGWKNAIKIGEKKYGKVDILINNAGIMPIDWFVIQDRKDKMDMIDINLKGVINGMDTVLSEMIKLKSGTIVNVSSVAGKWTNDWRATYSATKFGVHALTESVRREVVGNNVRVLLFAPAMVDTALTDNIKNKDISEQHSKIKKALNKGITSEEAADLLFWMCALPQHISIKELVFSHTDQRV